jgi:hypothetical protein
MSRELPRRRVRRWLFLAFTLLFLAPIAARATLFALDERPRGWAQANWSSVGRLPPAAEHPEARVLVLCARTGGWRGVFAVHSWIVMKPAGSAEWIRYDVVGWGNPVRTNGWAPDGRWRGNDPTVVVDVRGADAAHLIPRIQAAVSEYRWQNAGDYRMWPGPNSNTFVATVLRAVPELGAILPAHAIGRDFRPGFYAGPADSGTGVELSLWGLAGFKLGWIEGVEINLLGLVAGVDLRAPALKVPGVGRIGFGAADLLGSDPQPDAR